MSTLKVGYSVKLKKGNSATVHRAKKSVYVFGSGACSGKKGPSPQYIEHASQIKTSSSRSDLNVTLHNTPRYSRELRLANKTIQGLNLSSLILYLRFFHCRLV